MTELFFQMFAVGVGMSDTTNVYFKKRNFTLNAIAGNITEHVYTVDSFEELAASVKGVAVMVEDGACGQCVTHANYVPQVIYSALKRGAEVDPALLYTPSPAEEARDSTIPPYEEWLLEYNLKNPQP